MAVSCSSGQLRPDLSCLPLPPKLRTSTSGRCHLAVHALTARYPESRGLASQHHHHTYERILRYPDGKVRRILYPIVDDEQQMAAEWIRDGSVEGAWDIPGRSPPSNPSASPPQASATPQGAAAPIESRPAAPVPAEQASAVPIDASGELVRFLASDAYRATQREHERRVRESYEVLDGSPWVQTRWVHALADGESGQTYTLPTRRPLQEAEDELSKARQLGLMKWQVLGRRGGNGGSLISIAHLCDGIVVLEDEDDAERFAAALAAEGHPEVLVARVDAHELFRAARGVGAAVVLLRSGVAVPLPHELATSLRAAPPLPGTA